MTRTSWSGTAGQFIDERLPCPSGPPSTRAPIAMLAGAEAADVPPSGKPYCGLTLPLRARRRWSIALR